jgi:hypothetical protein
MSVTSFPVKPVDGGGGEPTVDLGMVKLGQGDTLPADITNAPLTVQTPAGPVDVAAGDALPADMTGCVFVDPDEPGAAIYVDGPDIDLYENPDGTPAAAGQAPGSVCVGSKLFPADPAGVNLPGLPADFTGAYIGPDADGNYCPKGSADVREAAAGDLDVISGNPIPVGSSVVEDDSGEVAKIHAPDEMHYVKVAESATCEPAAPPLCADRGALFVDSLGRKWEWEPGTATWANLETVDKWTDDLYVVTNAIPLEASTAPAQQTLAGAPWSFTNPDPCRSVKKCLTFQSRGLRISGNPGGSDGSAHGPRIEIRIPSWVSAGAGTNAISPPGTSWSGGQDQPYSGWVDIDSINQSQDTGKMMSRICTEIGPGATASGNVAFEGRYVSDTGVGAQTLFTVPWTVSFVCEMEAINA